MILETIFRQSQTNKLHERTKNVFQDESCSKSQEEAHNCDLPYQTLQPKEITLEEEWWL